MNINIHDVYGIGYSTRLAGLPVLSNAWWRLYRYTVRYALISIAQLSASSASRYCLYAHAEL